MLRHGHRVERGCSCSGSAVIFYQLCTHVCQFMRLRRNVFDTIIARPVAARDRHTYCTPSYVLYHARTRRGGRNAKRSNPGTPHS